jgi:hypothetical protein
VAESNLRGRIQIARAFLIDPRTHRIACDVLAMAFILAAFIVGVRTTHDLRWPYDLDHWRDIAQAQTAREGHPLSDPNYRGEWFWYNPLLAWFVALGSVVSGADVRLVHVRIGPYLTLLGPITFYLLARRIAGATAAVTALALYLFVICGNQPSWTVATYSPWLFAGNFAQGLFYASLLALLASIERPSNRVRMIVAGVLLGLTFLAHTAPAVILGIVAIVLFAGHLRTLAVIAACAMTVSSPFLISIGLHYGFHVVNPAPIAWEHPPISAADLPNTLYENGWLIAAGLAGLAHVWRRGAIGTWLAAASIGLVYNVSSLPRIVPAFHFWLYVTAALAILAGATLAWLVPRPFTLLGLTLAGLIWYWPTYTSRSDLRSGRAQAFTRNQNLALASDFLQRSLRPDEVVLGSNSTVNLIIAPAGRKTVAAEPVYSNPYVPIEQRTMDREAMFAAVNTGNLAALATLSRLYAVSAVVTSGPASCEAARSFLKQTAQFGTICVFKMP